jgi:hypothetical protein
MRRTTDMKVQVTVEIEIPNDYHPDMAGALVAKGLMEVDRIDDGLENWQIVEIGRPVVSAKARS